MKIKLLGLSLASLIALSEAKKYEFKVVSIMGEGYTMGVKYGTTVQPLTASTFPLFTGSVEADNLTQYKYVALDSTGNQVEEETINRTYSDETSKINEVYNRTTKDYTVPTLPQPFKAMFPMGADNFKPLPHNIIYNIYAKCDPTAYESITSKPFDPPDSHVHNDTPVNCTISIISPHSVYQSSGSIHLIGFGSRLYKKLTFAMKLDKKFMGRKSLRLRAMASDPSLVREHLSIGLYKAVGVPVQEGTYARLFINGDTYGLYGFIDSISKKWIAGYVHGNAKANLGISYKLYSDIPNYPDFKYRGDNFEDYSLYYVPDEFNENEVDISNDATKYTRLLEFVKLFDQWVNTPGQPVDELKKFFNIEATLRLLVIDTLTLALDNFFIRLSNAALYYNPERNNYVLLPYDFDKTLKGGSEDPMLDSATYIADCHTWVNQHEDTIEHYLTNNLFANPEIKKRYDVILAKTSTELFNENVISTYVHSLADLIREDVEWNFDKTVNLNIPYDGIVNHYTKQDFEGNIDKTPVEFNQELVSNDAPYGVLQWVDLRSKSCIADTANIDISNNDNISDNLNVNVYEETNSDNLSSDSLINLPSILKITLNVVMIIIFSFLYY